MLRLLRRRAPRIVETAHFESEADVQRFAERGLLLPNDLCARAEGGTLAISEIPTLEAARVRGQRRDLRDVLFAAILATVAGVAVKAGGTAGGLASVPLLAGAHVWLQGLRWRKDVSIETLPTRSHEELLATEHAARRASARRAAGKVAGLLALAAVTLIPAGLFAKFGAAGVTAVGLRRIGRRTR